MPDTKNLSSNLQGFLSEFKAKYPNVQVTSGYRPRAFTKQGALSRHAKGEAIDIAPNQEAYNYLWNTEEGLGLLNKYGLGILDETSKEMLEKTGGTGAHYHVGADSTLVPKARERYNEFLKQKAEKEGNINPKLIDFDFSIKSDTFVENSEEEEKEPVEVKEEVVTEVKPDFDQEQFNTLVNYSPVAQQQEQLPQSQYQQQDINSLFAQISAFVDAPVMQQGGTWEKQQARMKAEKDAKLKVLLAQEKPVYKKKTVDEKIAEKRAQENTKTVQKDATNVRINNRPELTSKTARNKTDKEIAEERKAIREKSDTNVLNQWSLDAFNPSNYTRENLAETAQGLESKFRISDEPNFFDDYINPAAMIGSMADNLGQAPLRAQQEDSYMPYVTAIGTPLAVGAVAGIGTQNTGQFVNNLANPLAGTGDLVNNLGNKYLSSVHTKNPFAFKPTEGNFYRQVDSETFSEGVESGLIRGKQDVGFNGIGGINLNRNFGDLAYYNKNTLYYPDNSSLPYLYESKHTEDFFTPMVNNRTRGFTRENTNVRVSNTPFKTDDPLITMYKTDWLQGYTPINQIKSSSNPIVPIYRGLQQESNYQSGGVVKDNNGYLNPENWGKVVEISSPSITMKGVNQPLIGIADTGEMKTMIPGLEYFFSGAKKVTEIPLSQEGGWVEIDRGNGKIEKINTGSNEYRTLYEEGRIGVITGKNEIAFPELDNITVTAFRKTKLSSLEPKVQIDEKELQQKLDTPYNFEVQKDKTTTVKEEVLPEVKVGQKLPNKEEIKDLASTYKNKEELLDIEAEKLLKRRQELFDNRSNDLNPEEDLDETLDISKLKTKEEVLKVQKRLDELGYNLNPKGIFENDGIDGKLGNVTKKAIETYNQTKAKNIYSSYKEGEGLLGKCTEKQCSEYAQNEIFRNFKPSVKREIWNDKTGLYGDAWTIGNHIEQAGGKKVQKVQPGDAVTMYTGGGSSYLGEAKKYGTDATHIGIVDKVNPDGSYYILHNVHEGSKDNYEGKEYRDLIKDGKIVSGGIGRSFEIRGAYRPNYDAVKEYEKKSKVREDVILTVHPKKLEELQALNKSYTGANIQKNVNELIQPLNNINNKKVMTQKHGLTEEEYQSIAKLSLGILAQESGFGTSDKLLPKEIVAKTLQTVGLRGEASEGAGQIKYKINYGDSDLTEFSINESNFDENEKTPLVVADRIATYYRQLIKKGETKESALYKAVEKYNRGRNTKYADTKESDYVNKVINFSELFLVQDKKGKAYNTTTDKLLLEKQVAKKKVAK